MMSDQKHPQLTRVHVEATYSASRSIDSGLTRVLVEPVTKPTSSRIMTAEDLSHTAKINLAARFLAGGHGDAAAARRHFLLTPAETMAAITRASKLNVRR